MPNARLLKKEMRQRENHLLGVNSRIMRETDDLSIGDLLPRTRQLIS